MAERHPRLIVSTEGREGSGKTHFALSAPGPITYLDFDYGVEGVDGVGKVDTHKTYDMLSATWLPEAQAKRYAQDVMKRFVEDYREAIRSQARTIVVDTMTAAWRGQRIARSEDKYAEMEEEFVSLIRAAYASPHSNVIFIHHLQRDWKRTADGKPYKGETWSRDGMDGISNAVQLAIRQRYTPPQIATGGMRLADGKFEMDVLKARDNIGLVGLTFPAMDFATLGAMVAPAIDWSK